VPNPLATAVDHYKYHCKSGQNIHRVLKHDLVSLNPCLLFLPVPYSCGTRPLHLILKVNCVPVVNSRPLVSGLCTVTGLMTHSTSVAWLLLMQAMSLLPGVPQSLCWLSLLIIPGMLYLQKKMSLSLMTKVISYVLAPILMLTGCIFRPHWAHCSAWLLCFSTRSHWLCQCGYCPGSWEPP